MTVSLEVILRKGFSKSVGNLIPGSYWEDLDGPEGRYPCQSFTGTLRSLLVVELELA